MRPWDSSRGNDGAAAEETQRRCLAPASRAIDSADFIVGVFLWKWFPGRARHEDFLMSTPAMRRVIADHWAEG